MRFSLYKSLRGEKNNMKKKYFHRLLSLFLVSFFIIIGTVFATGESFQLVDNSAKINGTLIESGNITATVYDSATGGTLLYNETFVDAVVNGSYAINVGNDGSLNLTYGNTYYYDLSFNGIDWDDGSNQRKAFVTTIGDMPDSRLSDNVCLLDQSNTFFETITINKSSDGYAFQIKDINGSFGSGLYLDTRTSKKGSSLIMKELGSGVTKTVIDGRNGENSYIDNGGNFGIGTTNPAFPLQVNNNAINSLVARFIGSDDVSTLFNFHEGNSMDAQLTMRDSNIDKIQLHTAGHTYFNGGNVGIGTASPAYKLDVNGTINANELAGNFNWTYLQNYPSACPSGTFVTQVGDSITCTAPTAADVDPGTFPSGNYVFTGGTVDVDTLNTGQGDNELYAMNQNVRTSDSPTFSGFTSTGNSVIQGDNKYLIMKNSTNNELASFGISTTTGGSIALRDVTGSVTTLIRGGSNSYFNGGNVGIGTTSPSAKLHIIQSGNGNNLRVDKDASGSTGVHIQFVGEGDCSSSNIGLYRLGNDLYWCDGTTGTKLN